MQRGAVRTAWRPSSCDANLDRPSTAAQCSSATPESLSVAAVGPAVAALAAAAVLQRVCLLACSRPPTHQCSCPRCGTPFVKCPHNLRVARDSDVSASSVGAPPQTRPREAGEGRGGEGGAWVHLHLPHGSTNCNPAASLPRSYTTVRCSDAFARAHITR